MTTSESFVRFDKVDKSYDGEILVVKDLNLDVPKGEFLTMLGPSGSGKTTVLMMLAGFETPTSGEIYLDGEPISSIPPYKRGIGMVFQNYALFPHMTVNENLAFPLEVRNIELFFIFKKVSCFWGRQIIFITFSRQLPPRQTHFHELTHCYISLVVTPVYMGV